MIGLILLRSIYYSLMLKTNTKIFVMAVIYWEIVVALIYGFFLRYNTSAFSQMNSNDNVYSWSIDPTTQAYVTTDSTQAPFPFIVLIIAIALLVVGFAMIAGYIERNSVTGMAFTLLIFAFTAQNFFIYRTLWRNFSVNDPNASPSFKHRYYNSINLINFGNDLQSPYAYTSDSFLDAVGASLAMYAAYSAVIGRISLAQIFILTWIGPFIYEANSQLLWRFYIPDTGFTLRAFAFGGALGLVSSLILGKRELTAQNVNYFSRYKVMSMSLLGMILVWCSFPIVLLGEVFNSTRGYIVALTGQVNIWLALASSALGCFSASSLYFRKLSAHDLIFSCITGGIAFAPITNINYNPGAATAIGFGVGFVCSLTQMAFKRKINSKGIIDSNSALFHFLMPSFFAAILVAIAQGVGNTYATYEASNRAGLSIDIVEYKQMIQSGRSIEEQGGFQIIGWLLSIGFGSFAGVIIGLLYKAVNEFRQPLHFFNDAVLYNYPRVVSNKQVDPPKGQSDKPVVLQFDLAEQ